MNARRVALRMISGKIIFYFGVQKRLRAFLYPIFTGEGEDAAFLVDKTLFPRTAKSSPLRESWENRQVLTERGVQEKFSAVVTSVISVQ